MTKKDLALRDGADHEEALAGELGLIEFATAPGASPDQLAWELQKRYLVRELVALMPVVLLVQGLLPAGGVTDLATAYALLVWPVILLNGTWQPMRRSRAWSMRPLADLCFLGSAGLVGLFVGGVTGGITGWAAQGLLPLLGLARGPVQITSILLGMLLGGLAFLRVVAVSLAERELESLPDEQLPSRTDLDAAAERVDLGARVTCVARAAFRSSGLLALGCASIGLAAMLKAQSGSLALTLAASACLALLLLAGQTMARAVFYLFLTRGGLLQLEQRRRELEKQDLAEASSRASWRQLRDPRALAATIALAGVATITISQSTLGAAVGLPAMLGVVALVPLIPMGQAQTGASGTALGRVGAGALAALPAGGFLLGTLWLCRNGGPIHPLLGGGVFLLLFPALERAAWLWARATRRLIHRDERPPGPEPAVLPLARRAALLGAALGVPALVLNYLAPWGFREMAQVLYRASVAVGPFVALLAAMRMHLAVAEAAGPPALEAARAAPLPEESPAR